MILNKKQSIAIDYLEDKITTEVLFGGGAGGGKSILGCYWLSKMCFKYPESRWVMGRASMKTLKETTFVSFLKMAKMQGLKAETHFHVTSPQQKEYPNCILFPNKSVILLKDLQFYPSDPDFDELGSLEITGAFIDEGNQVTDKAKAILGSRMRHNITEYKIVPKLLVTCNPAKNWVYRDFYKPFRDGNLLPHRNFIQSLVTDNPDIDPTYYQNLLKLDKNSKERLLYGNWEYDDDPAALIGFEAISNIFTNTFVPSGEKFITCDVARFGKDKTTIGVWDGYRVKIYTFKGLKVTEVANRIESFRQNHGVPMSNIIADEDGVGGGVVDILGCHGFVNNSRPIENQKTGEPENYDNLKSQCYYMLAEIVNANQMYIDCEDGETKDMIVDELEQVKQFNMDKDGKKRIIPKDKVKELIGRSPDYSDLLMMRMWFSLGYRINFLSIYS
jgi:phage terminase large subunit